MAKANPSTPSEKAPPEWKKSSASQAVKSSQKLILGFFQKAPSSTASNKSSDPSPKLPERSISSAKSKSVSKKPFSAPKLAQNLTPVPSSDAVDAEDEEDQEDVTVGAKKNNGLPSPVTPADVASETKAKDMDYTSFSSPSRKVSMACWYELSS
jgi:hypothetical protein